jgi:hypothetical protein
MAQQAEALGFDFLWVFDHVLYEFGEPPQPRHGLWECWSVVAALAAATTRVELGPYVANTGPRRSVAPTKSWSRTATASSSRAPTTSCWTDRRSPVRAKHVWHGRLVSGVVESWLLAGAGRRPRSAGTTL